ncbi:MAG: hypothetical protein JSS02_28050, partial [Planctomycetes bacterium]|nr:hypothetical protein [Planctomycetota bacterium]
LPVSVFVSFISIANWGDAGVLELQREGVIRFELLGNHADVANLHAELVVGCTGLLVMGWPSVASQGTEVVRGFR